MAREVTDVDTLQKYFCGVMEKAECHAENVKAIALAILGAVVWRKEGDIEVREYSGKMTNMLWFRVRDQEYALKYNYEEGKIGFFVRPPTQKTPIKLFDNSTPAMEVYKFFRSL